MVILEFPSQFNVESSSPSEPWCSPCNPTIVFRHETDSVISDCSNCSCRISNFGKRRPECCIACAEMKDSEKRRIAKRNSMELAKDIPHVHIDITDQNISDFFSPKREDHVLPTSIALLSKVMIGQPTLTTHNHHRRTPTDPSPPSSVKATSFRRKLTKSKSAHALWTGTKPSDTRSIAITADLSLDHELS